jgi:hypothetical protein
MLKLVTVTGRTTASMYHQKYDRSNKLKLWRITGETKNLEAVIPYASHLMP